MKNLTNTKGFTLIELVVVIVILGILAATAAPKFIDLTGDAKASIVDGVRGSLNSAADMAHAKALVEGETKVTGSVTIAGSAVTLKWGWPDEDSIASLIDYDDDIEQVSGSNGTFQHKDASTPASCVAVYEDSGITNAEIRPSITSSTGGC
ncbi:type II secretion system protein [Colwelliaceae bacterium 6441]